MTVKPKHHDDALDQALIDAQANLAAVIDKSNRRIAAATRKRDNAVRALLDAGLSLRYVGTLGDPPLSHTHIRRIAQHHQ